MEGYTAKFDSERPGAQLLVHGSLSEKFLLRRAIPQNLTLNGPAPSSLFTEAFQKRRDAEGLRTGDKDMSSPSPKIRHPAPPYIHF